jgi:3-dehydroquinate dehydratase II
MNILVMNGPNLNRLGKRDATQYGSLTLVELESIIISEFPEIAFSFIQSDSEEIICSALHSANEKYNGIILNPAGFTHTSVAIRDAIEVSSIPVIEVHLSNVSARENFRKTQITTSKATGYISGFKENSYLAAVYILKKIIHAQKS